MMNPGRQLAVLTAGALLILAGEAAARSGAAHPTSRAAQPGPIGFSHAVVVDEQRPGFEPDVKVDGNGTIYSSVPFGFSTTQSFVWASRDRGNSYLQQREHQRRRDVVDELRRRTEHAG